jgi:putative ABC transport system ATP-binding protein
VDLDGVRFAWPGPAAFTLAVDRFAVPRGARLLLVGPSGSGKSTLLNLVCGIALPSAGRVRVLGTDLARLPGPARDRFRAAHIGIIFQMFNLLPYLSVLDNVLLPLSFAPERRARTGGGAAAPGEARRLLARLGLDADGLAGQPAARLSVGQQQRVAAARALIGTPEIVIADEPTSALDRDRQQAFLDLLFAEVARAGASLVMVSHDATLAPLFDRTVRLDEVARPGTGRGEGSAAPP